MEDLRPGGEGTVSQLGGGEGGSRAGPDTLLSLFLFLSPLFFLLFPSLQFTSALKPPTKKKKRKAAVQDSLGASSLHHWEALRLVPFGPKNPKVFWELPAC